MMFLKAAIILAYVLMTFSGMVQDLRLEVRAEPTPAPIHVVLTDGEADLATIALPEGTTAEQAEAAVEAACWSPARDAVILSLPTSSRTFLASFVRNTAGEYVVSNLDFAEAGNFGKLGRTASSYQRFQTIPVALRNLEDGSWHATIETKVWEAVGNRERVSEPVIITSLGTPLAS